MNLILPLSALESDARSQVGPDGHLREVKLYRLEGGYIAEGVYRIDLGFDLPGGEQRDACFVQKYARPREWNVLRALNAEVPDPCLPRLVEGGAGEEGQAWFVYPYYPGDPLGDEEPIPTGVLKMLARIHARFAGREKEFPDVPRVDGGFFHRAFDAALSALSSKSRLFAGETSQLIEARSDQRLYDALDKLPPTLAHGDVHTGNLIRTGSDGAVLIDWGNARLAPGALDLANMVDYGSPEWQVYVSAWEEAAGKAADEDLFELAYRWAVIQVNTQYLPFAVSHMPPEHPRTMAARIGAAQMRIHELMA
jgi:aminoglycoside phosphotransferase (APT) family kinase protein